MIQASQEMSGKVEANDKHQADFLKEGGLVRQLMVASMLDMPNVTITSKDVKPGETLKKREDIFQASSLEVTLEIKGAKQTFALKRNSRNEVEPFKVTKIN